MGVVVLQLIQFVVQTQSVGVVVLQIFRSVVLTVTVIRIKQIVLIALLK
jgi:hypothetical protein